MSSLLPFIVSGLVAGSIYGLAGIGLVLTYKTSGIFNFAYGALAAVGAYTFYGLFVQVNLSWGVSAALAVLIVGPALGIALELIARRVAATSLVWQITATIGILLVIEASYQLLYGSETRTVDHFLPRETFNLFGTRVSYESLIIFVLSVVIAVALFVFFRVSRVGSAMRAVVDDPALLSITGTSPTTVRRYAWIAGSCLAVLSGILLAPNVSLQASSLTLLVVQAFGAAAVGRFSNLPMTWVGGIIVGVCGSVATKYFSSTSILGSLPSSLPFVLLFVILLTSPRAPMLSRSGPRMRQRPATTSPLAMQALISVIVIPALAIVPLVVVSAHLVIWTSGLIAVVLFMSLGLLVRTSGQISLCQVGFAAIGAVVFSRLLTEVHVPWIVALLLAGLATVPFGAFIAIPAIRLNGLYLALATLGFGLTLNYMFYSSNLMFGPSTGGLMVPRPHLDWLSVDSDKGFYYVVLVIVVLVGISIVALGRGRFGRSLMRMSDSPVGLSTSGVNVDLLRLLAFCISAGIAGISGALMGSSLTFVSGTDFDPFNSLVYVAVIMIAVGSSPWNAVVAGLGLIVIPGYIASPDAADYLQIVFGVAAVAGALGIEPRFRRPRAKSPTDSAVLQPISAQVVPGSTVDGMNGIRTTRSDILVPQTSRITGKGIRVAFGGLVAVDDVQLSAKAGAIVGLIGPNGAGKTTTFNVLSGIATPQSGSVWWGEHDISRVGLPRRARLGIGRTFQQPELFDSLTVEQNVSAGYEGHLAGAHPLRQFFSARGENKLIQRRADEALALCGVANLADRTVGSLTTGQRRLVELARCLAGRFNIILLDEPSAGLDKTETALFGAVLRTAVRTRGIGILLVEHDMELVMDLCDYIYVLDFGKLIFEGTPVQVQQDVTVRAAYLGSDAVPAT
ncbi:ABC transporter permease subunit [Jatrophihabitans sp. DSM 45814]